MILKGNNLQPNMINNGRGGEARTPNTRFWRPVLYQLNYAPRKKAKPNSLK